MRELRRIRPQPKRAGKLIAAAAACLLVVATFTETSAVPVQSIAVTEKQIAFTFDVGEADERLAETLLPLHEAKVTATFFLTAEWVERNPLTAKAIVNGGHELGKRLFVPAAASEEQWRQELARLDAAWNQAGLPPSRVVRVADADKRSSTVRPDAQLSKLLQERGETVIGWSINAEPAGLPQLMKDVNLSLKPGDILRLQADASTAKQLPGLLQRLQANGWQGATVLKLQAGGSQS